MQHWKDFFFLDARGIQFCSCFTEKQRKELQTCNANMSKVRWCLLQCQSEWFYCAGNTNFLSCILRKSSKLCLARQQSVFSNIFDKEKADLPNSESLWTPFGWKLGFLSLKQTDMQKAEIREDWWIYKAKLNFKPNCFALPLLLLSQKANTTALLTAYNGILWV